MLASTILALALVAMPAALAAPVPVLQARDGGSAYSGVAGSSVGGSVTKLNQDDNALLNLGGGDFAGNGGSSKSGNAHGGHSLNGGNGGQAFTGAGGRSDGGSINESDSFLPHYQGPSKSDGLLGGLSVINTAEDTAGHGGVSDSGHAVGGNSFRIRDGGSSFSGVGGSAKGGNVYSSNGSGGLLNFGGNRAGNGGKAKSGNSRGGSSWGSGNGGHSYSGAGGNADGGSVIASDSPYGQPKGLLSGLSILKAGSNKAGNGGDASSGDAIGGSSGPAPIAHYYY